MPGHRFKLKAMMKPELGTRRAPLVRGPNKLEKMGTASGGRAGGPSFLDPHHIGAEFMIPELGLGDAAKERNTSNPRCCLPLVPRS